MISLISLVLFLLGTIGLTNILVHGKIMDVIGLRPWLKNNLPEDVYEALECYECTGFWSGMLIGLIVMQSGCWQIISWFEYVGLFNHSGFAYFVSCCVSLLLVTIYKIFFTFVCGCVGSVASSFYHNIHMIVSGYVPYDIGEEEQNG